MSGIANINLPSLIAERRQEKRRCTRNQIQRDLEVIASRRKYKKDLEPFPKDTIQRLYQDNVWVNVLGFLEDASDVTSAYFPSPNFAEILEERRKLILLPETLKVLHEGKIYRDEDGLLTKHDLLSLRGTSKAWKKEADRRIFEEDFLDESWFLHLKDIPIAHWDVDFHILSEKSVNGAMDVLSNVAGIEIPLLRKLCIVEDPNEEDSTAYLDKVVGFLNLHGHSVWYLVYHGKHQMSDITHLRRILELVPNLKALELSGGEFLWFPYEAGLRVLERDPFPIMDSVEYLFCQAQIPQLQEHLLKRCVNLKCGKLDCSSGQIFSVDVLEALESLPLERFEGTWIILRHLRYTMSSTWTLKVLSLQSAPVYRDVEKGSVIWSALNRLGSTLEVLKIQFPLVTDEPYVPTQLPHLKCLELNKVDKASIGFDDVLGLKSLETMVVENYDEMERPHDENALVKVFGIQKQMERSNICACFPNLKRLEFTRDACVGYVREGTTLTQYRVIHNGESDWEVGKVCRICELYFRIIL